MTTTPPPAALAPDTSRRLRALTARWTDVGSAERANYQIYLIELCEALGLERPRPAASGGRIAEGSVYQFEFAVGTTVVSMNFVDLYISASASTCASWRTIALVPALLRTSCAPPPRSRTSGVEPRDRRSAT